MNVEVANFIEVVANDSKKDNEKERVFMEEPFDVGVEKDKDWATIFHEFTKAKLEVAPTIKNGSVSSAERLASYLDRLDGIISRVIRADVDCEITASQLEEIDEIRAEIASRKIDALHSVAAISNCGHIYEDRTEQINAALGVDIDPPEDIRHEVCVSNSRTGGPGCGRINTITVTDRGDYHSSSGITYKNPDNVNVACNDCGDILYKNSSANTVECLSCQKVLKKTAAPGPSSRFVTDPFMHALASDIINAKVSSGYSLEDTITKAEKDFGLTKREQFLLRRTIQDMGLEIGQMIWAAPAQTTYASVKEVMTKKSDYESIKHVDETLQHDDRSIQFFMSEVERILADNGVDIDDVINDEVITRSELENRFISEMEIHEREEGLLSDDPRFEFESFIGDQSPTPFSPTVLAQDVAEEILTIMES